MRCARLSGLLAFLCALILCTACGGGDEELGSEGWKARADEAFALGDAHSRAVAELEQDPETPSQILMDGRAEAVLSWRQAARDYRRAFRLEDPLPERAEPRALLAFRAGRALSKAARSSLDIDQQDARATEAFLWFGEALALSPTLRAVWFERAVLHDSGIGSVTDPGRAVSAYWSYLAAVEQTGEVSENEELRVERAKARIKAVQPAGGRLQKR